MSEIRVLFNTPLQTISPVLFAPKNTSAAHNLLNSIAGFAPTPLLELKALSTELGLAQIWVKDESQRLGLNAFKAVGAVYAVARVMAGKLRVDPDVLSFAALKEKASTIPPLTFTTATDGNHGKAVAWAARELGQRAVIYMPHGTSPHRLQAIRELGAEAHITSFNYDDAVRLAAANAALYGWELIQDTAWPGYTEIPTWIMQGYTVIAREALDALPKTPTHIILQAGVGSFAGALLAYFVSALSGDYPITIIAEPHNAACIFKSAQVGDGQPHRVEGDLATIMAGLSCGEPNPIAWEIIRDYAQAFCSCPDNTAECGMQVLAHPRGNDPLIVSGESGAVGLGLLIQLSSDPSLKHAKDTLKLNAESRVLVINTEGDTDPESYQRIIQLREGR